jgi:hypothetical protein
MVDKTGMASLIDQVEALCLDFEAFRFLYKQNETRWAVHLNSYRRANRARVRQVFDAVRERLQETSHSGPVSEALIETLEKVMLPQ